MLQFQSCFNWKSYQSPPRSWILIDHHHHPQNQIIRRTTKGIRTRLSFKDNDSYMEIISQIKYKSINEAIIDNNSVEAMKEELPQFEKNEIQNSNPQMTQS